MLGEEVWNWGNDDGGGDDGGGGARVGPPLGQEEEAKKKEKEREKKKRQRARQKIKKERERVEAQERERVEREREEEEQREEEARRRRAGYTLGHAKDGVDKKRAENVCDFCDKVCKNKRRSQMFRRLEYAYCSTDCVRKHQKELMAAAATAWLGGAN